MIGFMKKVVFETHQILSFQLEKYFFPTGKVNFPYRKGAFFDASEMDFIWFQWACCV